MVEPANHSRGVHSIGIFPQHILRAIALQSTKYCRLPQRTWESTMRTTSYSGSPYTKTDSGGGSPAQQAQAKTDRWNTRWMHVWTGGVRWYATELTASPGNGPRNWWSSLWDGRIVGMCQIESQRWSPTAKGGTSRCVDPRSFYSPPWPAPIVPVTLGDEFMQEMRNCRHQ